MAAAVRLEAEAVAQLTGTVHLPHAVLRREVVGGAVVITRLDHGVQIRVLRHREAQILARGVVRVVPRAHIAADRDVLHVRAVSEHVAQVHVHRRREGVVPG